MNARVYVPNDTGAQSVGADDVADAITARLADTGVDAMVVRNGSRGAYWMEPLVEVGSPAGRIGFANVTVSQVPLLFDSAGLPNSDHPLCVGVVADVPWLSEQKRVTFARAGIVDPL